VQSPSRPATAPASSQGAGQNLNIQSVLQNAMAAVAAGGNPGTGTPQLTPEAVSRAMQDALNRLPPEQRASQLSALRGTLLPGPADLYISHMTYCISVAVVPSDDFGDE